MSLTPPPIIDPPPPAPIRGDRATFSNRVDAFVNWLILLVSQIAAVALNVYNNATSAFLSAQNASTSQIAAKLSEDNAQLYKTTAQSAAAAAQSAAGLPALKAGRVLRSPDGVNVEFGNVDGDVVYTSQSKQIPLAKTVLANSINGLLELTTPSNPQPGDWFVVADQGIASKNNVVIKRAGANLAAQPESMSTGVWGKAELSVSEVSYGSSPNGASTVSAMIPNSNDLQHYVLQNIGGLVKNEFYTFSVFVKAGYQLWSFLTVVNNGVAQASVFRITDAGTVYPLSIFTIPPKIEKIGDGWYRVSITIKTTGTSVDIVFGSAGNADRFSFPGDNVSASGFFGGAKFELGTSATFYDPVTASQNLIPYSAPKITGWWGQTRVTAPDNSAIAPDGSMTAVMVTEDTNNGTHAIDINHTPLSNTYYTFSIDVAPIGRNWVLIELNFGGIYCICWFDILTGVIGGNSGAQNVNISKNAINGYYRISISSPITTNTNAGVVLIYVSTGNSISTYIGDGRAALAVANVQLEKGLITTPRIATNGTAATRTGNPTKIMGITDDLAIRRNYQNCRMTYQDDLMGWVLR